MEPEPEQIGTAPRIGTKLNTAFILGMGKHDRQFIRILDIDRTFTSEEIAAAGGMAEEAA